MSKERPFEDITPVQNIRVGYFEKEKYLAIIDRQEKQIEAQAYQIMALQSRIKILEKKAENENTKQPGENSIKILQTIADKLYANEIGYDEEYEVIQYCQWLLQQKEGKNE